MQQEPTIPQTPADGYLAETPSKKPSSKKKREGWRSVASTILVVIAAPVIALFLTAFVFQSYEVDGPSMETSLQNRDRLIVLKTGKTWARLFGNQYLPKRGEIIVFEKNDSSTPGHENGRQLIKRVVGLPGDHVVVKEGKVTIYNGEFPEGFDPDETGGYDDKVSATTPGSVDLKVPDGEVFVMGDNRTNSLDSRSFGTIASSDIIGSLSLRIYPFSELKKF